MTKESGSWLVIRTIGLVLAGQALLLLYGVCVQIVVASKLDAIGGSLAAAADREALRFWVNTAISALQTVVLGVLAFYFLCRGKVVHRMLMREEG